MRLFLCCTGRRIVFLLALFIMLLLVIACGGKQPDFSNVDFSASPYRHITNGGLGGDDPMPYNIDAITGATLTVEGPAVVTSIPLSVRELENRDAGMVRAIYEDEAGKRIYEGMDLYHLLTGMVEGDNGILLTDKAYRVALKNSNRADVASFTLDEIVKAHRDGRPILLAYGVGTIDQKNAAPFVFDAANENEHSAGYVPKLDNDDGCLRLVYDLNHYGQNDSYTRFANVAYVYVCEETEPGFKHITASDPAYASSEYADYIVTFRGAALGRELDMTVRDLESLVSYDENGALIGGGVGYSDFYSLANTTYWYVNEYEGLDLYKLLLYLGMDSAETMGLAKARTTLVQFVAADGVLSKESFSVDTLSYPDAFGFYNKNAADTGDGSYAPTNADLVQTGYPVLLAYGVNRYPYTVEKGDDGYLSGLSNSGGPLRVVFGKTQYNHANGSNQVQYLSEVIVGDDRLTNTHRYANDASHAALQHEPLSVAVFDVDGGALLEKTFTVGEIEDVVYGEGVAGDQRRAASVKDFYQIESDGGYDSAIYEGINLEYLLMDVLGLPGRNGTITFTGDDGAFTCSLDALFQTGFHTTLGRSGLVPLLAFAKNGSPLVPDERSEGYVSKVALHPALTSENADYTVENSGGPLAILLPSTSPTECDARAVRNVRSIRISLVPDAYAHLTEPYAALAGESVRFFGEGLEQEKTYTLSDLEGRQTEARTLDYSVADVKGVSFERRLRGVALYDLFTEIGIKSNAGDVIVTSADGTSARFPLSLLKKRTFVNTLDPNKPALYAMLAYGAGRVGTDVMAGLPLVPTQADPGYDAAFQNDGGALLLAIPQESADDANADRFVRTLVSVEVTANDVDTWSHHMSDVYSEFLDYEFALTIKNDDTEWSRSFTVSQLESMKDLILRERYSVLDIGTCEGLDLWKLVKRFAGDMPGLDDPVSVTVYAEDGYKNDLLSVFYLDGFTRGVADENGVYKPILLAYAFNGCPLVNGESHEGYTGLAGNTAGPLRVVTETNQGTSVKYVNKLVVTLPGSGALEPFANQDALRALDEAEVQE